MTDDELERMIDAGSDFMYGQAATIGIDAELVKLTGMKVDERRVLERFALHSEKLTANERISLRSAVQRLLLAVQTVRTKSADARRANEWAAREHQRSTRSLYFWSTLPLLLLAVATYSDTATVVDTSDGTVMYVQTSWWGIARQEHEIRWMQIQDPEGSYWMAQDKQGSWYPFLIEE